MVFRLFDTNKDGTIDADELVAVIRRYFYFPCFRHLLSPFPKHG